MAQKKTKKTYSMPEKQRLLCRWTFELAAFLQEEHNMDKKAALELAHLNRELILHLGSGRVWFIYMKEDGTLREAQGTLCNGISQKFDEYEYKNTILAGYGEYTGKWNKFSMKAGVRYEYTWQDVDYKLGNGEDFKTSYGNLVPCANLQYNLGTGSNLGLTYNMRISRPGISYLNPYVDKTNPIALTYGNPNLDVEKTHNLSLVYNMFTSKLMLNLNLHHNFTDNGISQYSFYDNNNLLNTTYGNVVKSHQTGMNAYVNYLVTKNTRLFMNGSVNYIDLRSDALDQSNSGWTANIMAGVQQTLPWNLKLSAFAIASTKNYTLQGWSGGFNLLTASISKSLFNDKLNLSISGMTGLNNGGSIMIESSSHGQNFTSHTKVKVPIYGVSFTVSYTFGNSKMSSKQHQSRIQNDYIEQQSQGEIINSVGDVQQ